MKSNQNKSKDGIEPIHQTWDDDLMWLEIESELDKDKRKFFWMVILILFFLGSLIFSIFIFSYSIGNKDDVVNKKIDLKKSNRIITNQSKLILSDNDYIQNQQALQSQEQQTKNLNIETIDNEEVQTVNHKSQNIIDDLIDKSFDSHNLKFTNKTSIYLEENIKSQTHNLTEENQQTHIAQLELINSISSKLVFNNDIKLDLSFQNKLLKPVELSATNYFLISQINMGFLQSNKSISSSSDWQIKKAGSEKEKYSQGIDLLLGKYLNSNTFLMSGIKYDRDVTFFTATDTLYETQQIASDTAKVVNGIAVAGTLTETKTTIRDYHVYNKYQSIRVPLFLGTRIKLNSSCLMIAGGVTMELFQFNHGYTLDFNNNVKTLKDASMPKSFGVRSLDLFASYNIKLAERMGLVTGLNLSYGLKPTFYMTDGVDSYTQKHRSIRFSLGLSYIIN